MYMFKKFLDIVYGDALSAAEQDLLKKFRASDSFLLLTTQNYAKHGITDGNLPTMDNIDDIFSVWANTNDKQAQSPESIFSFFLLLSGWMIRHAFVESDPRRTLLLVMMHQYYMLMKSLAGETEPTDEESTSFTPPHLDDPNRLKN